MRTGLLQTVQFPDDLTNRFQTSVKGALETLAADHDLLSVPVASLAATGAIAAGKSVVFYRGAPGAVLTLPAAAAQGASVAAIVLLGNASSGAVTLLPAGANTVNGAKSLSVAGGAVLLLVSDGVSRWFAPGAAAGAGTWTDFTQDLGKGYSGTFDITGLSGLGAGKNVALIQTAQAIASKGGARDEFLYDNIELTGYVVDAATIRVYWNARGIVVGTYAFAYQVGG